MYFNSIADIDFYKSCHYLVDPPGTQSKSFYLESRGGDGPTTTFFGLSYYIQEIFGEKFTKEHVREAESVIQTANPFFNFNRAGWLRIIDKHGGYIPLEVRAVREGTTVPKHNALMRIEPTDDEFPWLAGWFETALMRVWYPTTVLTSHSLPIKRILSAYLRKTDGSFKNADMMFVDFGSRGTSCPQQAAIGGLANLACFKTTETAIACLLAQKYYNCPTPAATIPATEHSVMTLRGREGEKRVVEQAFDAFKGKGHYLSIVLDSYNYFNSLISNVCDPSFVKRAEESNTTIVCRPDSGDPVYMVLETLNILKHHYKSEINSKGYRVFNNVRVLQGDGINIEILTRICKTVSDNGYCISNLVFGMGGALLQSNLTRDTHKFAIKCSAIKEDDVWTDVTKDPDSDPGKRSKGGRLELCSRIDSPLDFSTVRAGDKYDPNLKNEYITYHRNGEIATQDLNVIRGMIDSELSRTIPLL